MLKYIKHHLFQYLIILLLFAITVLSLISNISYQQKILFIGISIGVYFIWGIWHHWEDHELTASTFLEYLVLSLFLFWLLINLAN